MWQRRRDIVVLAAEDAELRQSLTQVLEKAGLLVLTARSGTEALARLKGLSSPALAIVDVLMPGRGGVLLIQKMRAHAALSHIPIIALGQGDPTAWGGVDCLLEKPVSEAVLLGTVEQFRQGTPPVP